MFNLANLISKIHTDTGYDTSWVKGKEPSMANLADPPHIYVGYFAIQSQGVLGEGETPDYYNAFAEDLGQVFQTELTCDVTQLHSVWLNLYHSVSGWIPLAEEYEYTGIYHSGGGKMGITNGRIWWLDNWRIDFPRANPLI